MTDAADRPKLGMLLSTRVAERYGESLARAAREGELELVPIVLPGDPERRVAPSDCARIDAAYFSGDLFPDGSRAFFAAALGAPKLRWLQTFNAGIVTPHDTAASRGNEARQLEIFLENLARFGRGEPLHNEVRRERDGDT